MFRNYLKIAIRNLVRHKVYSFINILGLALGLACSILILLWVWDELSFDKFHKNVENIYRVTNNVDVFNKGKSRLLGRTSYPLAPVLKKEYPEITRSTRYLSRRGRLITYKDKKFTDHRLGFVDPDFFEMFTFPFTRGNPAAAFTDPFSIVITEEMASKYFGEAGAMGKILTIENKYDFKVTGVVKNVPGNSSILFDFLVPAEQIPGLVNPGYTRWGNITLYSFILLRENTSFRDVEQKIADVVKENGGGETSRLFLQSMADIHLSTISRGRLYRQGEKKYLYIFSALALLILLIACINFMNLSTARAGKRAMEIGIRKAVGAQKRDIIRQFFGESAFLSSVAFIIAVVLAIQLLPVFNTLSGKNISIDFSGRIEIILGLLGVALFTGIVSGAYPALFLSSFQPVAVLKRNIHGSAKTGGGMRKGLVVVQFAVSVFLIISAVVISNQLNYLQNKDLGFNKENIVYVRMTGDLGKGYGIVKNKLKMNPNILDVTASSLLPVQGASYTNSDWKWEGKREGDAVLMNAIFVDFDFFKTFGMDIVEGRVFAREFSSDAGARIVNETAARIMGFDSVVGKRLSEEESTGVVIGVVRDYHFDSLYRSMNPLIILLGEEFNYLIVRLGSGSSDLVETIDYIERVCKGVNPGYPFEFGFLDERIDSRYKSVRRLGGIINSFTVLAIVISCLGLFGLSFSMAENRTKEIGIRKILGSSVHGIVILLSREFSKCILMSAVIAVPCAWYFMNGWLRGLAYRIYIGVGTFVFSIVVALFIALLTVGYQSVKVAFANPVDSLRNE